MSKVDDWQKACRTWSKCVSQVDMSEDANIIALANANLASVAFRILLEINEVVERGEVKDE